MGYIVYYFTYEDYLYEGSLCTYLSEDDVTNPPMCTPDEAKNYMIDCNFDTITSSPEDCENNFLFLNNTMNTSANVEGTFYINIYPQENFFNSLEFNFNFNFDVVVFSSSYSSWYIIGVVCTMILIFGGGFTFYFQVKCLKLYRTRYNVVL